jgi:aerobic carbon-monoxide dehydrogenase medium subunit
MVTRQYFRTVSKEGVKMVTFYRCLPRFDYVKPKGVEEALSLLGSDDEGKVMVFAGGTDVIPKLKGRLMKVPEVLVDLKGIPDLNYLVYEERSGLRIGALATIFEVAHSPFVKQGFAMLSQAANAIASTQVQNRGTIVGNICNAVPSADSAPALLCLGAKVVCVGKDGEREVDIGSFFTGPNKTALNMGEMVKEIRVPKMSVGSKGAYLKLSPRSKMDLAVVGVGAMVVKEDGVFKGVKIGLGAVAPTPMRARKAEGVLIGSKVSDGVIERAAKAASEESKPIDDHRASAEYRRIMVEVLVRRAIRQCLSEV